MQHPLLSKFKTIGFTSFIAVGLIGCGDEKAVEPAPQENQASVENVAEAVTAQGQTIANPAVWPSLKSAVKQDPEMEKKIAALLEKMTLKQKVAQMIQPEIRAFTVEQMREYGFGSYLNGGGAFPNNDKFAKVDDWLALADAFYDASVDASLDGSSIPTMWGTDAVHGHNNVIGATIFPHNIGLGAANNPELIKKIGAATAAEVKATGIEWIFAPTVAVVRDDRWGRTYEGYSEDPDIVKVYAKAMVEGLQGSGEKFLGEGKAIATAKHFIGDGGTDKGDDQGNNLSTEEQLRDIHGQGYITAIESGVQTIMASFNSWNGKKMHGNRSLLTDVLKEKMGFDGLVVGDWDGHAQVAGCEKISCAQAINAGVDIIMVPNDWELMYKNTLKQVESGEIAIARINDAVTRILRVKMRAGLFDAGKPSARPVAGDEEIIGSSDHRAIAQQAVRESLVLLKNKGGLLPLAPNQNVLVVGDAANDIGKVSGGWTISWQGTGNKNADFPGATSVFAGIESLVSGAGGKATLSVDGSFTVKPDVAIAVFGENPYAEGEGDIANLQYQRETKKDLALLKKLKASGVPVVSVFITGRPLWVNKELNASDAFVVAWLPGSEGAGVAEVIFKNADGSIAHDFAGKLSFSWPKYDTQAVVNRHDENYDPLFPYGFGLTYKDKDTLGDDLSEEAEKVEAKLADREFELFKNRPLHGLELYIGDSAEWAVPVNQSIMTSKDSENITVRAINWKVQEDARQVVWAGDSLAVVYLAKQGQQENYYDFLENKAALTFDFRVDERPTSKVELKIDCGYPCSGTIDVQKALADAPVGEWQSFSVDLACFEKAGTDFSAVSAPWVIATEGRLSMAFANVKYVPQAASQATIQCAD